MSDEHQEQTVESAIWHGLTQMGRYLGDRVVAIVALVLAFAACVVPMIFKPSPWFAAPAGLFVLAVSSLWRTKGRT